MIIMILLIKIYNKLNKILLKKKKKMGFFYINSYIYSNFHGTGNRTWRHDGPNVVLIMVRHTVSTRRIKKLLTGGEGAG